MLRAAPLVRRDQVLPAVHLAHRRLEPVEAARAGVRLVAELHRGALLLRHRRRAAVGQQVDVDVVGAKQERVEAGRDDRLAPGCGVRQTDRLDDLDLVGRQDHVWIVRPARGPDHRGNPLVAIGGGSDGRPPGGRDSPVVETMWAIRKLRREPGLVLDRVPIPEPGPHDVLVQVEAASVCGTDLHIFKWDDWAKARIKPPLTLGHEFAGTVVEMGEDVRTVVRGDYVSAESHVTCGMCFHCRTGRAHMCERTQILGVDRDGAFAEFVVVPESVIWQNDREKLPPEIATLQEPFGNAVFATSTQDLPGRTVAVLGCGPVGLFTIAIARASGAGRVLASDHVPFRLSLAEALGAEIANVNEIADVSGWFHDANEGAGLDVVFEMSGAAGQRSATPSGSSATAATSSSSASRARPSSWTSPSR